MKYKAGDRVKVREDLVLNKMYDGWVVVFSMTKLAGKIIKIKEICDNYYTSKGYAWTDEMFSGLADEPTQTEPNRLEIASRIMAALIMANYKWSPSDMAKESLKHTDALITELNKPKP